MAVEMIVSDTGPLISLEKITGGYALMGKLYRQILLPDGVAQELWPGMFANWEADRQHYGLGDFVAVVESQTVKSHPGFETLDEGEQQAIHLGASQLCKCHSERSEESIFFMGDRDPSLHSVPLLLRSRFANRMTKLGCTHSFSPGTTVALVD